jgi:hypothetical protein
LLQPLQGSRKRDAPRPVSIDQIQADLVHLLSHRAGLLRPLVGYHGHHPYRTCRRGTLEPDRQPPTHSTTPAASHPRHRHLQSRRTGPWSGSNRPSIRSCQRLKLLSSGVLLPGAAPAPGPCRPAAHACPGPEGRCSALCRGVKSWACACEGRVCADTTAPSQRLRRQ